MPYNWGMLHQGAHMSRPTVVDVSDTPELLRLAEEVRASRQPLVLAREDELLAVVRPVPRRRASRQAQRESPNQWLGSLVGIARSEGPTDVSANKHRYLAEAHRGEAGKPAMP
jgi:hypothetical protein